MTIHRHGHYQLREQKSSIADAAGSADSRASEQPRGALVRQEPSEELPTDVPAKAILRVLADHYQHRGSEQPVLEPKLLARTPSGPGSCREVNAAQVGSSDAVSECFDSFGVHRVDRRVPRSWPISDRTNPTFALRSEIRRVGWCN